MPNYFSRREFLIGTALAGLAGGAALGAGDKVNAEALKWRAGDRFNESREFDDKATGRRARQLTTKRKKNQQPTYHLNACFSADSQYMVVATIFEDGSSALLRAEVATGELTVLGTLPGGGKTFTGNNIGIVQAGGWVAASAGGVLHLFHLTTLEHRVLIESAGPGRRFGHPTGSIDGRKIYIPHYGQQTVVNGMKVEPVTHLEIEIGSGKRREIVVETGAQCNHVVACPGDPEVLLIDRDWPPKFGSGGDHGKTSRVWIMRVRDGALTEVRPRDPNRFQIHSNWNCKGDRVYYHGTHGRHEFPTAKQHYIGVADKQGRVVWEHPFNDFIYGHICSHTRRNTIITDGLLTRNQVTEIFWEEAGTDGAPRTQVLAQHDSDWAPGQFSHPHCHVSPDGQWLSYNRGEGDRSNVCVGRIA